MLAKAPTSASIKGIGAFDTNASAAKANINSPKIKEIAKITLAKRFSILFLQME